MGIVWRQIRSRRAYLDSTAFTRYVEQAVKSEVGPIIVSSLTSHVRHWRVDPQFRVDVSVSSKGLSVYASPTGPFAKYWIWVSKGVSGRFIRPRSRKAMAFRARYAQRAKSAGRSTSHAFSKGHWWPGIVARNFEAKTRASVKPTVVRVMENIMRRAVNKARRGAF